jgi:microcystin-dependent protein
MPEPAIGEIRIFAGNFAPAGWMFCDGQLLSIAENDALFTLIGTTYGGDGQSTFALPNLQGRIPIHIGTGPDGSSYTLGEMGGVEDMTLSANQIPTHTHPLTATTNLGSDVNPANRMIAQTPASIQPFIEDAPTVDMRDAAVAAAGENQPHLNMQPFLGINYIISLFGIFPSAT